MRKFWSGPLFDKAGDNAGGGGSSDSSDNNEEKDSKEGSESNDDEGSDDSGDSDEDKGEEEEEEFEKLTPEDEKEAKALYKLLKDKTTQASVIKALAERAGVLTHGEAPSNKKEEKAAKKELKEILKEGLGPEYYGLLGDKLEKVLNTVLEQEREQYQTLETAQIETKVDAAFESLARETKGDSNKFKARMTELADELPKGPTTSVVSYLRHLYTIASAERRNSTTSRQIADKINRNANNAADRLGTRGSDTNTGGGKNMATAPKGLKAIVEAAVLATSAPPKGKK